MSEWPTKDIGNDSVAVQCPEGEYKVVGSALPRFQTLDEKHRLDAKARAKRFGKEVIDTQCL